MVRELTPVDITDEPALLRLVEEVERTGRPRRLRRGGKDVAVLVPVPADPPPADPGGTWVGYDPARVQHAMTASRGVLAGMDTEQLKADLKAEREQASHRRPA